MWGRPVDTRARHPARVVLVVLFSVGLWAICGAIVVGLTTGLMPWLLPTMLFCASIGLIVASPMAVVLLVDTRLLATVPIVGISTLVAFGVGTTLLGLAGIGVAIVVQLVACVCCNAIHCFRFQTQVDSRVCSDCNYDRRGLPPGSVCPECGAPAPATSQIAKRASSVS
jgi:hypothetical protein